MNWFSLEGRALSMLFATALACGLAVLFAHAGACLLRRKQRGVAAVSVALLVGLAGASTVLFPLSLMLPANALIADLLLIAFLAFFGRVQVDRFPSRPAGTLDRLLVAVLASTATIFAFLNFRRIYDWDGFQIWATKAYLLFHRGALTSYFWVPSDKEHAATYPPMVPLYEALLMLIRGEFSWELTKPVFLIFYLVLLILMYHAARAITTSSFALYATAFLALIPGISIHTSVGGYADMPLACFVCGLLYVLLSPAREDTGFAAAWLFAGLLMVKNEGSLLFLLAGSAVLGAWLLRGRAAFVIAVEEHRIPIAIAAGALLLRIATVAWHNNESREFGYNLPRALDRISPMTSLAWGYLTDVREWGLIWPTFVLACIIVIWRGCRTHRILALFTAAGCVGYTAIFLFTNWDLKLHADSAYHRIFIPIVPAALLVIVSAAHSLLAPPSTELAEPEAARAKARRR